MKTLSKQKRQQLVLVVLGTAAVLASVWFSLISAQHNALTKIADQRAVVARKLDAVRVELQKTDVIEAKLTEASEKLGKIEAGMASGDLYSWTINTLRQFKVPYKVEMPQFSQIDGPKDCNQMANFPYKQASLSVGGTAHFHEFGRFIADFENQFPWMRILNLTLEPDSTIASDPERLSFKMEIATLVKPGAN
jgi:Tfp pilus assembly protein PilO